MRRHSWLGHLLGETPCPTKRNLSRRSSLVLMALEDRTLMSVATHLAFAQEPPDAMVGKTIVPPIEVIALDRLNQVDTSFNGAVALALQNNPGNAELSGTKRVKASSGRAVFSDISVSVPGTAFTFVASFASLPSE